MKRDASLTTKWARNPSTVRRLNDELLEVVEQMPALVIGGVSICFHHIHLGPGVFLQESKTSLHRHEQIQIEFVLEGQMRFKTESQQRTLRAGQGIMTGPEVPHAWEAQSDTVMLGALLRIEGARKIEFQSWAADQLGDALRPFSDRALQPLARWGLDLLTQQGLWSAATTSHIFSAWLAQGLRTSLPLEQWAQGSEESPPRNRRLKARGKRQCDRALEFMRQNLNSPPQVQDIAREVGVSPRHLNRLFDEYLNRPISRMMRDLRMKEAHRLLKSNATLSVKEVAYRTGFTSTSYFTRCFQEDLGLLPSEVCTKAR